MPSTTTTTLLAIALPLLALLPLTSANQSFYIGYSNGNKVTWKEGDDTCMAEYQTLVGGPNQEHAAPCDRAFTATDESGNTVKLAYNKCGSAPPEVWEVDRVTGAPTRQLGSCHDGYKETGKQETHECGFFDGNIWDGNTGHDTVIEWTCEIAL
jgi:hypothetical protein